MKLPLETCTMQRNDRCELADLSEPSLCRLTLVHLEPNSNQPSESTATPSMDSGEAVCASCGFLIADRYILKVMDESYHEGCLRCAACHQSLASNATCFAKHGHVYCQQDHSLLFGKRCRRCLGLLSPTDIVYRCMYMTYHSHCFHCYYCSQPFNKGDEYFVLDGEIFCRNDYQHLCQMQAEHASTMYEEGHHESSRKTPKRPRTILNAQQRRQFKSAFDKSSKPCRKIREQLAKETGLSVRVVQVWFQNQRAKMKKMGRKDEGDSYKAGTNSEERSTGDGRTSDDEGSLLDLDSDDGDLDKSSSLTNLSNPIQKLYNMTSSQIYFPFATTG